MISKINMEHLGAKHCARSFVQITLLQSHHKPWCCQWNYLHFTGHCRGPWYHGAMGPLQMENLPLLQSHCPGQHSISQGRGSCLSVGFSSLTPVGLFTIYWVHSLILLSRLLWARSFDTLLHPQFSVLQLPPDCLLFLDHLFWSHERRLEKPSPLTVSHFQTRGWAVPGQVPIRLHFPVAEGLGILFHSANLFLRTDLAPATGTLGVRHQQSTKPLLSVDSPCVSWTCSHGGGRHSGLAS